MGLEHFKQMYEDALALDCKAAIDALRLTYDVGDQRVQVCEPGIWQSKSFDEAMRAARKLVRLYEETYLAELQEMAAAGLVQVRAAVLPTVAATATPAYAALVAVASSMHPTMVTVNNPEYLGSDEQAATDDQFFEMLEKM
jgi:hypothetical protein